MHFAVAHSAVPVRYRDELRDDGMGVAFAQTLLDQYSRKGTSILRISSLTEQAQLLASLIAHNSGIDGPCGGVRSRKEETSDAVVVEETEKTWILSE